MADATADEAEPFMDMFDRDGGGGIVCRVCGSLVAPMGEYPRAHWDWHEASNGA